MNYKGFEITTKHIPGNSRQCWDGSAVIPGEESSRLVATYHYTEQEVIAYLKRCIDYWTRPYVGVKREKLEEECERLKAENLKLQNALQPFARAYQEAMKPTFDNYIIHPGDLIAVSDWENAAIVLNGEE